MNSQDAKQKTGKKYIFILKPNPICNSLHRCLEITRVGDLKHTHNFSTCFDNNIATVLKTKAHTILNNSL